MPTKLSARAWEILLVIDERTKFDDNGKVTMFWCPGDLRGASDHCDRLNRYININGAGDARIIKSLAAKGLVAMKTALGPYACAITEDGRLAIEQAFEKNAIPLQMTK